MMDNFFGSLLSRMAITVILSMALTACESHLYREPKGFTSVTGSTFIPTTAPYQPAPGGQINMRVDRIDGKINDSSDFGLNDGTVLVSPGQHLISVMVTARSFMSSAYNGIAVTPVTVAAGRTYHIQAEKISAFKSNGFVVNAQIVDAEGTPACDPFEVNVAPLVGLPPTIPIFVPAKLK